MSCEFYDRVEVLLKEQKKSQKDFVKYIGLSLPQTYVTARSRGSIPRADIAVKMAEYLNTTVEFLVTGKEENPLALENQTLKEKIEKAKEILS